MQGNAKALPQWFMPAIHGAAYAQSKQIENRGDSTLQIGPYSQIVETVI
jgi:hypothetical protein